MSGNSMLLEKLNVLRQSVYVDVYVGSCSVGICDCNNNNNKSKE